MAPRKRTEARVLAELEELTPRITDLEELRAQRDRLLVELVVEHGYSRQRAAELGKVSRSWVGRLVAGLELEPSDA